MQLMAMIQPINIYAYKHLNILIDTCDIGPDLVKTIDNVLLVINGRTHIIFSVYIYI